MASPRLLVWACAAVLIWMVESRPATPNSLPGRGQAVDSRMEPVVEGRQLGEDPSQWFLPDATIAATLTTPSGSFESQLATTLALGLDRFSRTAPTSLRATRTVFDVTSRTTPTSVAVTLNTSKTITQSTSIKAVDTMPADAATSIGLLTPTDIPSAVESSDDGSSGAGSNKALTISLGTILPALGLALVVGAVLFWRYRRRRLPFMSRGVSPIDDDEIERWKSPKREKGGFPTGNTDLEADGAFNKEVDTSSHSKNSSTSSTVKKPPSVVVYSNPLTRRSTDADSRKSLAHDHVIHIGDKTSFERSLPQAPIHARAPNARAGLTDESIPGDEPFIAVTPKRTPSRLSKLPGNASPAQRRANHGRARSSRSSTHSFGDFYPFPYTSGAGSDMELSPRYSHENLRYSHHSKTYNVARSSHHSRVYSSSSVPPRLSLAEEAVFSGLSSPGRARLVGGGGGIGRAVG